jgi:hypothetical protein
MNGLLTKDLRHTLEVPPIALMTKDRIVRHPEDGSKVSWRVTDLTRDEDGHRVAAYTDKDGNKGEFTFKDPDKWVRVDAGLVTK